MVNISEFLLLTSPILGRKNDKTCFMEPQWKCWYQGALMVGILTESTGAHWSKPSVWGCKKPLEINWALMGVRAVRPKSTGQFGEHHPKGHWMKIHHDSRHIGLWKTPDIEKRKWSQVTQCDVEGSLGKSWHHWIKIYSGFQSGQSHKRATREPQW